jgi:uncharacterized protein YegP (UPF0339 family)
MRFEVSQLASVEPLPGGEWRWRLRGEDDEIIAHGGAYASLVDCVRGIALVHGIPADTPVMYAASGLPVQT